MMLNLFPADAWQTCITNSGFIKQVSIPCCVHRNNTISAKQAHHFRSCRVDAKIPDHAARFRDVKVSVAVQNSVGQIQPGLRLSHNSGIVHRAYPYLFRTELGGLVKVLVGENKMKYAIHIEVSSLPHYLNEYELLLSWGMFRADSSHLYASDTQTSLSSTSQSVEVVGHSPIQTAFTQKSLGTYAISLEFDISQVPFYLSFFLLSTSNQVANDLGIRTHRKTNFCVPVGMSSGCPMPLGVSANQDGSTNFALFSRGSKRVVLCLHESDTSQQPLEIELDPYVNRTGDVWHVSMESVGKYFSYGYRCKGELNCDKGSGFHAHQVLLDPYAKLIDSVLPNQGESQTLVKCLGKLANETTFDWTGDVHPWLPMEKLVIYRLNVRNFTKDKSSAVPGSVVGTFAGVTEKLQHFITLGMNAVLLEPIFSFDVKKGPYFPYHFFSPMTSYGNMNSMKEMVKTLHAHGIEVLLEVVFTHTGEGGEDACQTISFQGIDNPSYYITEGSTVSGVTKALNCNNPIVQQLILESLHYWLAEFHVDGFCFINSSHLLQGPNGDNLSRPPLVEAIAFDPLLSRTKIIADCWSPVDISYVNAHFPHWKRWAEMNARFCSDIRNFLRGEGRLSDLATRLCGSGDLFSDSRGPAFSFNYITKNFGLPLVDLVSFSSNELASELSWNCGVEGSTNKKYVLDKRLRQIRNFLFVLFISLGVPVVNMGDECGLSTGGSLSSADRIINWNGLKTVYGKQITQFIAFLSSLRVHRSDLFQRRDFLKVENIDWHGSNGSQPSWDDQSCRFLAVTLKAEKDEKMPTSRKGDLFLCFNAGDFSESAILPQVPEGFTWIRLIDTALTFPGFFSRNSDPREALSAYEVESHSCVLFEAQNNDG